MSVDQIPLGLENIRVEPGTHIAFPYRSEQERASSLLAYVKAGLENVEKCVAAVLEYTPAFWVRGLADLGIDAEPLMGKQFIILGPEELYAAGVQGLRTTSQMVGQMAEEAGREGWKGLRVCSSLTTLLQTPELVPAVLEGEVENCRLMHRSGHVQLCTLSRDKLPARIYELCLRIHSVLLADGQLKPNPDYTNPGTYLRQLPGILRELADIGALNPPFASLGFVGGVPVLKVIGEMDVFTAPQLEDLGRSLSLVGHNCMIVDLSRAPFLDAAAISTILRLNNLMQSKGGRLSLCDPEQPLRRIFQLISLDQVVPIRHNCEEALQEVRR